MPKIGDAVTYVDQFGKDRPAVLTQVWGPVDDPNASVNLVIVSNDEAKSDGYGRQIERETSVVHAVNQGAHGRFWR